MARRAIAGQALRDDIEGILEVISMTVGDNEECAARKNVLYFDRS